MQNRELTNAVSQLNESLKILNSNYALMQNNLDDKLSRLDCENIELKNRVTYLETKLRKVSKSQRDSPNRVIINNSDHLNEYLNEANPPR